MLLVPFRHGSDQLRSVLYKVVGTEAFGRRDIARHGVDLPALFVSHPGSDERPTALSSFYYYDSERHAAYDSIPEREILRQRWCAKGEFGNERAAPRDLLSELSIFFRIDGIQARAHDCDSDAAAIQSASMSGGINSSGKARDYCDAAPGELP